MNLRDTVARALSTLAFTSDGRPRVVGMITLSSLAAGLRYFECDTGCDEQSGWSSFALADSGAYHLRAIDLAAVHALAALDRAGNPRIAYDALNGSKCWFDNNPGDNIPPQSKIEKLFRAVRFVIATK